MKEPVEVANRPSSVAVEALEIIPSSREEPSLPVEVVVDAHPPKHEIEAWRTCRPDDPLPP